mmetsp:Transcript_26447/g.59654  ORF Transcript_26447/g.59654 Transcript_26447/m.59654 type:complete len:215 (+) Transcript_26447:299-943(+)
MTGQIFVVWYASPAAPDSFRTKSPPMLFASVVTADIVESPPCFDRQPFVSSNQSVDLVYCRRFRSASSCPQSLPTVSRTGFPVAMTSRKDDIQKSPEQRSTMTTRGRGRRWSEGAGAAPLGLATPLPPPPPFLFSFPFPFALDDLLLGFEDLALSYDGSPSVVLALSLPDGAAPDDEDDFSSPMWGKIFLRWVFPAISSAFCFGSGRAIFVFLG